MFGFSLVLYRLKVVEPNVPEESKNKKLQTTLENFLNQNQKHIYPTKYSPGMGQSSYRTNLLSSVL